MIPVCGDPARATSTFVDLCSAKACSLRALCVHRQQRQGAAAFPSPHSGQFLSGQVGSLGPARAASVLPAAWASTLHARPTSHAQPSQGRPWTAEAVLLGSGELWP